MKHGPVAKLCKRNKATSEKIDNDIMSANCDFIVIFHCQSGSQILDAWSVKLEFLLIVTYCLTITEIRTKMSLTQLSHLCFE